MATNETINARLTNAYQSARNRMGEAPSETVAYIRHAQATAAALKALTRCGLDAATAHAAIDAAIKY